MPNFCCLSHYHPLPAFRAAVLRLMVVAVLSLAFYGLAAAQDRSPVIAAASDLRFALSDIITTFEKDTGHKVRVSYGSTGQFAQQIRQGAPYQIFMAADEAYIADLHRLGLTMDEGDLYAEGRIVLMVPHGSKLKTDAHLDHLASLLDEKAIAHFAIANPDHAPYGARAKEALIHKGIWPAIEPFLVLGENVSQAAQFALSGNSEGGIIAYSLALSPQLKTRGRYALIPADWHQPLRQRMVRLKGAGAIAEDFYAYMNTEKARAIMRDYGFSLPES